MAPKAIIDYSIKDVEKVAKFDGRVKNVNTSRLTAPGENYLSLVLRVDFEIEKNGLSKIISSVAKRLPLRTKKDGFDIMAFCMKNEIKWYSKILPLLKDFAKENDIKVDYYPECYGSRYSLDSSKQEADSDAVLLLENLIPQGYQNDDRYIGSDFITSKAILKSLALFHALPIVIKVKKPELFQILCDLLKNDHHWQPEPDGPRGPEGHKGPGPPSGPGGHKGPPSNPDILMLEALLKLPDFAPYISKVKPHLEKPWMGPGEFGKLTKEPWNTFTHNDFWVNNVMVNYKKGEDPQVKIVDFQMCEYGSFAKDLVFFLLSSVRNDVTREHLDDLLSFYYDEFVSVLQQASVNLELTYQDYMEEVSSAAQSQTMHALTFSTTIFGEKGTGLDAALEDFDPFEQMGIMIKKMNQHQKDKLVVIASEAIKRNWI